MPKPPSDHNKTSLGPSPVLTNGEEDILVQWFIENAQKGFPRRKEDLQISVKHFLDKNPRKNPFKNNLPNEGWYKAFLRRHPEIATRTSESVTLSSANVTEKDIKKWFENIETYLKTKSYFDILSDPTRIQNGDETCFNLCPKNTKVLAPVGCKNVYEVEHASSKYNITVMFTMSAADLLTPPMVIFPGKRLRGDIANSMPPEWGIGVTENGLMKADAFQDYIFKVLHPSLKQNGIKFPVILFIDGHSSHVTLELSNVCKELEIILICLYPNATRILQPADVAAFKPIKTGWKQALVAWRRENLNETLTKDKFAPILKKVVENFGKESTIKNGFRATGLYPFNPNAIDFEKKFRS
ncbi:hypothetical protein NQ318_004720 [Aromia moschata]|uniref:HTH CENPB-type domain-containing protein n=1 Tax=Aromia moschata TaxID=1265417 RepID=A0AAV8XZS9_9CUCU|nr:hypothetical protein NQ318_004720 [Aromia moschata]